MRGVARAQVLGVKDPEHVHLKTTELNVQRQQGLVARLQHERFMFLIDVSAAFQASSCLRHSMKKKSLQPDE